MHQFSVRLSDDRAAAVKRLAGSRGRSVNQTFEDLVVAATDPATAGSDVAALRERLEAAGLTIDFIVGEQPAARPDSKLLAKARAAAGQGTPLSEIVSEQRR